ncbi:hypothetical protein J5N97_017299 [Dioscorea zingiberensis]|uniref:Uncharacterized protein n=1 Tax=Dioscorea zingiberensis TaxID=325984 RepID=A0A9D5HG85_9LILI|nr:hypothetical protein J5N97_017299 [Dioscorea zingiberensis]
MQVGYSCGSNRGRGRGPAYNFRRPEENIQVNTWRSEAEDGQRTQHHDWEDGHNGGRGGGTGGRGALYRDQQNATYEADYVNLERGVNENQSNLASPTAQCSPGDTLPLALWQPQMTVGESSKHGPPDILRPQLMDDRDMEVREEDSEPLMDVMAPPQLLTSWQKRDDTRNPMNPPAPDHVSSPDAHDRLVDRVSLALRSKDHEIPPGNDFMDTRGQDTEPYPITIDFEVITLALIQLVEQYAYNIDSEYVKWTIGYTMQLPASNEISFTLGNAIPLCDPVGNRLPKGEIYDMIEQLVRLNGEKYNDGVVKDVFIRIYYESKESLKSLDFPNISNMIGRICNVMDSEIVT